jgi:hypothetical protein
MKDLQTTADIKNYLRKGGLEPPRETPLPPQSSASTIPPLPQSNLKKVKKIIKQK